MKATNKYNYYKVIQQYFGSWEDSSFYETNSTFYANKETRDLLKHDLAEYRMMGYPVRVIKRKELKNG
jgi:hypothetical protein